MNRDKILILSALFPPQNSSLSKRLYDLLHFFPRDSYIALTGKENTESKSKIRRLPIRHYYFKGLFYNRIFRKTNPPFVENSNFVFNKIIRKFCSSCFYISRLFETCFYVFYITKKENIKSILVIADSGFIMLETYILFFLYRRSIDLYFFDLYKGNNLLPRKFQLLAQFIENRLIKKSRFSFFMWEDLCRFYKKQYPEYSKHMITLPLSIIDISPPLINRKRYTGRIQNYHIV